MAPRITYFILLSTLLITGARAQEVPRIRILMNHAWGEEINTPRTAVEDYTLVAQYLDEDERPTRIVCLKTEYEAWLVLHVYLTLRDHLNQRYQTLLALGVTAEIRQELNKRKTWADQLLPHAAGIISYARRDRVLAHVRERNIKDAIALVNSREANSAQDELVRAYLHAADLDFSFASKAISWTVRIDPEDLHSRQGRTLMYLVQGEYAKAQDEVEIGQHFNRTPLDTLHGLALNLASRYGQSTGSARVAWARQLIEFSAYRARFYQVDPLLLQAVEGLRIAEIALNNGEPDGAQAMIDQLAGLDLTKLLPGALPFEGGLFRGTDTLLSLARFLEGRTGTTPLIAQLYADAISGEISAADAMRSLIGHRIAQFQLRLGDRAGARESFTRILANESRHQLSADTEIFARYQLAKLAEEDHQTSEARALYQRTIDRLRRARDEDPHFDSQLAHALFALSTLEYQEGQLDKAAPLTAEATAIAARLSHVEPDAHQALLARALQLSASIHKSKGETDQQRKYYGLAARTYAEAHRFDAAALRDEYLQVLHEYEAFYLKHHFYAAWQHTVETIVGLHPVTPDDPAELLVGIRALLVLAYTYYDHWNIDRYRDALKAALIYTDYLDRYQPEQAAYLRGSIHDQLGTLSLMTRDDEAARVHLGQVMVKLKPMLSASALDNISFHLESSDLASALREKVIHAEYMVSLLEILNRRIPQAGKLMRSTLEHAGVQSGTPVPGFEARHFELACMLELIDRSAGKEKMTTSDIEALSALGARLVAVDPEAEDFVNTWRMVVFKITSGKNSTQNMKHVYGALHELAYLLRDGLGIRSLLPHTKEKRQIARQLIYDGKLDAGLGVLFQCLEIIHRLPEEISAERDELTFGLIGDLAQYFTQETDPEKGRLVARRVLDWPRSPVLENSTEFTLLQALAIRQLGQTASNAGRTEVAFQQYEKARDLILALSESVRTDGQLILSLLYSDLAQLYDQPGPAGRERTSNAYAKSLVAFEAWRATHPELYFPGLEEAFLRAGNFYLENKDHHSAVWTLDHARAYLTQHRPLSPETAEQHLAIAIGLAEAYDALNRTGEANRLANRSLEILKGDGLKNEAQRIWMTARARAIQARSAHRLLLHERAIRLVKQADTLFARCPESTFPTVAREKQRLSLIHAQALFAMKRYPEAEQILNQHIERLQNEFRQSPVATVPPLVNHLGIRLALFEEQDKYSLAAADLEEIIEIYTHHRLTRDNRMDFYLRSLVLARKIKDYPAPEVTLNARRKFVEEHVPYYYKHPELGRMIRELRIPLKVD